MSACSWMSSEERRACVRSLMLTPCMLPIREWEGLRVPVLDADRCLFTCDRVPAHAGATEGRGRGGQRGAEGRGRGGQRGGAEGKGQRGRAEEGKRGRTADCECM